MLQITISAAGLFDPLYQHFKVLLCYEIVAIYEPEEYGPFCDGRRPASRDSLIAFS